MGANIVSVSVIRREKLQFMYNFNRFVAFMPFFFRTTNWNALPDSLISSAEDAEDCVAKFTSLVRARD